MPSYSTPQGKFYQQRIQAKQRGIRWELSFDEWWDIWQRSGKWQQRGCRVGQYVMARPSDAGPYSATNVVICTSTENRKQAHLNGRCDPLQGLGKGRGWSYKRDRKLPFQVTVCCKVVGTFATRMDAELAYMGAVSAARAAQPEPNGA